MTDIIEQLFQDKKFLKIASDAVVQTLDQYTNTVVTPAPSFLSSDSSKSEMIIAGVLNLEGASFSVKIGFGLSKQTFFDIYKNMFNEQQNEISDENQSLVGEIVNIACGIMDPEWRRIGYILNRSLPDILVGEKLMDLMEKITFQSIIMPFLTGHGRFRLELFIVD